MTPRRLATVPVGAALVVALGACSGGGSSVTHASATVAPSPTTATPPAVASRGGLIGTIDRARLLAACENIRSAATAVDAGQSASTYLSAAAAQLEQPPHDPAAVEFAANLRAAVAAGDDAAAVRDGLLFCSRQHA